MHTRRRNERRTLRARKINHRLMMMKQHDTGDTYDRFRLQRGKLANGNSYSTCSFVRHGRVNHGNTKRIDSMNYRLEDYYNEKVCEY